tara:strand:- start:226 stop:447 length:222 start_codon:yes stop_codon:yes gene_type:complete
MTTKLGRWCLQASEVYGKACKPEVKQLQNIYDHGFTTMNPNYFKKDEKKVVKKKDEEEGMRRDPVSMLFTFFN